MKVSKKVALSTAAVLGVSALAVGGTIAYFADNESVVNNFTVGNVDVTLYESQLHRVNANVGSYFNSNIAAASADDFHVCVPYMQGTTPTVNPYCTPNIAVSTNLDDVSAWQNGHVRTQNVAGIAGAGQRGVYSDTQIITDSVANGDFAGTTAVDATDSNPGNYKDYVADEYGNLVPGKQVRKFIYVKNTGENSAYVRVKITIPEEVAGIITVKDPHTPTEPCAPISGNNLVCQSGAANENINGVDFSNHPYLTRLADYTDANGDTVMTFVYTDALKKNELTYWSPITTVRINDSVKESDFTDSVLETLRSEGFGIKVDVDAIQSEGFASATAAFAAFDGNAAYENEHNE